MKLAPSLMCVHPCFFKEEILLLDKAGVDMFHIDIMDGHFVPNLALNMDQIKAVKSISNTPLDIHLMVTDPENYLPVLFDLQVHSIAIHFEVQKFPIRLSTKIRSKGIKLGLAINPTTAIDSMKEYLEYIDYVVVMTVEPGFAGQHFLKHSFQKIEQLVSLIQEKKLNVNITVDGNITKEKLKKCALLGVDTFVLGTASIFNKEKGVFESLISLKSDLNLD